MNDPKLCWNCKVYSVFQQDSVCKYCGIAKPYEDEEITSLRNELLKLKSFDEEDFKETGDPVSSCVLTAIISFLSAYLIYQMQHQIILSLLGFIIICIVVGKICTWLCEIPDRKRMKHLRLIESTEKRIAELQKPVLTHTIRGDRQLHTAEITKIVENVQQLTSKFSALTPANQQHRVREHETTISKEWAKIDEQHFHIWCADFALWNNRYVSFSIRRDNMTLDQRYKELLDIFDDSGHLYTRPTFDQKDACLDTLNKLRLSCMREIDELKVQKEAILVCEYESMINAL